MVKWRDMTKRERRAWVTVLLVGPLGFIAVGVALSGVAAGGDGEPVPAGVGVAAALLLAFWLGRRSRKDNTAVAVAQAVSIAVADARAEATAAALAQAHQQVAVLVGDRMGAFDSDSQMIGLDRHSAGSTSIPEAQAPREVQSSPMATVYANWPFTGAERVPEPRHGLDGFSEGATLEGRGDAPGDPVAALQAAQTPPLGGSSVT